MEYQKLLFLFFTFISFDHVTKGTVTILDSTVRPRSFDKTTKLHKAVRNKNYDLVIKLVQKENSFCLGKRDEMGRTPLGLALFLKLKKMAKILIKHNCRLKPRGENLMQSTPFHQAIFWNDIDAINYYLIYGKKNIFKKEDTFGRTVLAIAIDYENKALADILLEKIQELKVEGYRKLKRNRLHLAALADRYDVVYYYDQYKDSESFQRKDIYGKTPLNYALEYSSRKIISLIQKRLPEEMRRKKFQNPVVRNQVEIAAERNRSDVVEYFLRFDLGFEKEYVKKNHKGLTPLHIAAIKGYCDVLKSLLKHYVENKGDFDFINAQSSSSLDTALHLAARHDHLCCVKALLSAGADTYIPNQDELTPWREYKTKGKKNLSKEQREIRLLLKNSRKYDVG